MHDDDEGVHGLSILSKVKGALSSQIPKEKREKIVNWKLKRKQPKRICKVQHSAFGIQLVCFLTF